MELYNSKLIKVLKTFDKGEFKQFGKMVDSPFFLTGRKLMPLYNVFKRYYPDFNSAGFSKENILEELSKSGYKISSALLKTLMSEMYKLTEEFLTYQGMKKQIGMCSFFFTKNCGSRNLFSIGENKILVTEKKLKKEKISQSFYTNYYFNKSPLNYFYDLSNRFVKSFNVTDEISEIIIHNFLTNASRLVFSMSVIKKGFKLDIKDNLFLFFLTVLILKKFIRS